MLKSFKKLWLRGVKQLGNVQKTTTRKLIKNLLAPPKPARVARKPVAAKAAALPAWSRATLSTPGKRMEYWLYRPSVLIEQGTPLVVMLHGCDQTALEFAHGTRMNQLAEQKGFGVLYPQQSARAQRNRCWPWYRKEIQQGEGEVKSIAAIIAQVLAQHPFDPSRVYLGGMSAGAAMAQIVALRHPQMIAAVGLHSGPVFGAATSSVGGYGVMQLGSLAMAATAMRQFTEASGERFPPMPAILIQGQHDAVVRPVNLHQLEQQFCELNGLTSANRQPATFRPAGRSAHAAHAFDTRDYRVGRKVMLRVCEISRLSHAWSGGDPGYRFNERKGPDASRMMCAFFQHHRRLPIAPTP
ncbi:poly(hydroxyalkanoate) depolymerase family esterase [Actimicrobium sp. GrIS 1.19]|uniref:extracellular catalytic domain type 1 short-chain-length polyhydroxyalkanoate depolymerase n=1 Tax=Actimicrobium sp. GrIS 1.19 TaxID=3071708 RepID=UPI002DF9FA87|nr:poly(hydroxyalkanoate) depolymerase family esterase [Actimicrobium sp. GrIS 1.19]